MKTGSGPRCLAERRRLLTQRSISRAHLQCLKAGIRIFDRAAPRGGRSEIQFDDLAYRRQVQVPYWRAASHRRPNLEQIF